MPKVFILVGVPGSGKSTWISKQPFNWDRTVVASTDNHVEKYAKEIGKTYSEVFVEFMPRAVELMVDDALEAFEHDLDLVWDQTSTTISTRAKKIRMIPKNYEKIAVVFETPEHKELMRRLVGRWDSGKIIPEHVIASMISGFQMPTEEEGFDKIIHVS